MQTRTTQSTVRFAQEFSVSGIDRVQPAGDYLVDHDEELIEGVSWLAYRRTGTFIHLPAPSRNQISQLVPIDPDELEHLMKLDEEKAGPPSATA